MEGNKIHQEDRLPGNHHAIKSKHTQYQRYPTAERKISGREQKRDQIPGEDMGKHGIQQHINETASVNHQKI